MLTNFTKENINNNLTVKDLFLSATLENIQERCNILKTNFYLDSFYYFPITENYETFVDLFKRQNDSIKHFYNDIFFKNLIEREKKFKIFEKTFVLGSSSSDNYYSNLFYFLPRIFFINEKKINLTVSRNLSNKFRNFIRAICAIKKIEISFNYLDDGFYKFKNSSIPQFLDLKKSIKILKLFIDDIIPNIKVANYGKRIYVRRENVSYRKILNEADLIEKLRKNGFEIFNPNHFEILEQMKIFSEAELIVSPHGSNLSNIIFCKKGTQVIEIAPQIDKSYERNLSYRYEQLAEICELKHFKINSDSVDVDTHSKLTEKYISKKILNESNYYKNLILKVSEIDKLINSF